MMAQLGKPFLLKGNLGTKETKRKNIKKILKPKCVAITLFVDTSYHHMIEVFKIFLFKTQVNLNHRKMDKKEHK